jgi:polar amino acid transport system substrate-binding protein
VQYEGTNKIKYTVEEVPAAEYESTVQENAEYEFTVINEHKPAVKTVSGTKTWVDPDRRPHDNGKEITLTLKRVSAKAGAQTETLDAVPVWKGNAYTFSGLPAFDTEGYPYAYSVEEAPVEAYETRQDGYDFTNTYITITQGIVSKEANNVTMDTLKDQTIGVQRGTTGHIYAEDDFGEDSVVAYDTYPTVFQALMNDQVSCILMDDAVAKAYVAQNPGLVLNASTYEPENFAFGISKGNTALLEAVNKALDELIADGTVQKLIDQYMAE